MIKIIPEYSATCGHTSVAWGMLVSCKVHEIAREIKVAPRIKYLFVLDRNGSFCQGLFLSQTEKTFTSING